jgi:molybdopterin synthase catalytic subunit
MRLINGPVTTALISEIIAKGGENGECGSHSLFLQRVRRVEIDGRSVTAIEYSAYEELVIMGADKIIKTIVSEYEDVKAIEIIHSKGLVNSGEIFLLVMVTAGEMDHALTACTRAVELIRDKLPIVIKEKFYDNSDQ